MNQVAKRSTIALFLVVVLIVGSGLFLVDYLFHGGDWAVFPGNPHVYNGGNIACGVITDREGEVLLDMTEGRTYASDPVVRMSTLHWLGDREGYISAPAVSSHSADLVGYDPLNGLYSFGGLDGTAQLTLSARAQTAALQALDGRSGTVAVYNYKTGEILCAVTSPTYDPDNVPDIEGTAGYEGAYLNRFTQVTYVPGSIFKVVSSAAALEKLDSAEEYVFRCDGVYAMDGGDVTCEKVHGDVDMKKALEKSCNCYFAQLTELLGADLLEEYVRRSGVLEPVTFDGITTARGTFDIDGAADNEIAWSAIGQHHDLVNPASFLTFMGAIAGGGEAQLPYVVSSVGSGYTASSATTGRVMSEETAAILTQMLRNDVSAGYGDEHFHGLSVCAKSGTAQVDGGAKPNATFAGFVADESYPLAFVIVVENGGAGAETCVPILSNVLEICMELIDSD